MADEIPVPEEVVTAATKAVRRATLKVPCPEDREIALAVLGAAAPALRAQGEAAERERFRRFVRTLDTGSENEVAALYDQAMASGVRDERERIRAAAEDMKFTLLRPGLGNGPAHEQSLDVVPLAGLLKLIGGDGE